MKLKLCALSLALTLGVQFSATAATPLLMEGKSSIYQRVLTTPSCLLKKNASDKGTTVNAFSRYYVYKDEGGYLTVGSSDKGKIDGILKKDCTVDWKMQTALMFTNPANRNRALIFKQKDSLQKIIESDDPNALVKPLMANLKNNKPSDEVISAEPEKYIDYSKNFYLLPILDFEETMFSDGNYVRAAKIASVTKKSQKASNASSDKNALKTFKAAIVFVVDSSISMDPYINRTKQAIQSITSRIEKEHLQDLVHFGLVSFRSNIKAKPGLEYVSKMYVKPGEAKTPAEFENKLSDLAQAKVSSVYFDEDSFAGINTALESVDWNNYGGRYIVLVTDAGGIAGSDKYSTTGLDSKELRLEAKHKGVAIYAMHLLTDTKNAKKNHEKAKNQYQDLTFNEIVNKSLYYPVNAGDVNKFGKKIDELSANITSQVKQASFGKSAVGSAIGASKVQSKEEAELNEDTIKLGHAMQLAYLGSKLGTKSPDFLQGWIADRDLVDHTKVTSTPVVLLTKDQLSSLKDVTTKILDSANEGLLQPEDMFSQLRSVAVSLGRDPASISDDKTLKLGKLGLLGEYLEGLPYKSRIQELDEESWMSMGPDEQNQTIEDLENKLRYYQKCNDDASRWIKLNENDDASDSVYPIPLEVLP